MTDQDKNILVGIASFEGVSYAILVYLAATFVSWPIDFRPSVGKGELAAIASAIWPLLWIFVFANVHKFLQRLVCKHGSKPQGFSFALDFITSCAPAFALILAFFVDLIWAPRGGYYSWAYGYWLFISLIVAESVRTDVYALKRYT
jgi:hypothetical protein